MKHDNWNGEWSSDFDPYGRPMFNTVRVRLPPLCRCGSWMFQEGRKILPPDVPEVWRWRCPSRRWWNAWRHPDAYTLGER